MRTNDAQMLVLCTLADGPLHGYAVNTAVEKLTGERLGRGSLSGALARLEAKGLVEYLDPPGRRRRLCLTAAGRDLLEREVRSTARTAGAMFEAVVPDRIGYQDRLAATADVQSYKQAALDALGVRPGDTVLELGCGPGTDLAALAEAAAPSGTAAPSGAAPTVPTAGASDGPSPMSAELRAGAATPSDAAPPRPSAGVVLGLDHSPEMVARACARTAELPSVRVLLGDLHALPYGSASADRAHTDRVLQHVADPVGVLAEVRRVLRPGGRLVMAEPDWESLSIDHPDPAISRGYTRHIADRVVRNGAIGRQLPRLAAAAGFDVPAVVPFTTAFRDLRAADQVFGFQRNAERAVAAGYLTAKAARLLLDHLAEGPFFTAVTLYVVVAEVPAHR
jgi:ubiquinone/menaquinone biosynthesis C-methylase UbiE